MKKLKYKLMKFLVTSWVGNLQFFGSPLFFITGCISYKVKGHIQRKILDVLKPGDILVRRHDRYVSGWFIPGYWTHIGVYIGKNTVVHATTKHGVCEEDILTFLRCDAVIILRAPLGLRKRAQREIPIKAKEILGKPYDFIFDFEDNINMCCTEVVEYCVSSFPELSVKTPKKKIVSPGDYLDSNWEMIFSSKNYENEKSSIH